MQYHCRIANRHLMSAVVDTMYAAYI